MPGNYVITARSDGLVLTGAIYNADHQNHIDNATPQGLDDYSLSVAQMKSKTDPGEVGSESLATSTAGELERLRFALIDVKGTTEWYETPATTLALVAAAIANPILDAEFYLG